MSAALLHVYLASVPKGLGGEARSRLSACGRPAESVRSKPAPLSEGRRPSGSAGFSFIELLMVTAVIAILVALAVPHLQRVRMTAQEKSAQASVRTIFKSQALFHSLFQTYGDLAALIEKEFLDNSFQTTEKNGYTYEISTADVKHFALTAVPTVVGVTGEKGFYTDETGVIRYTEDGSKPTSSSPALGLASE